MTTSAGEVGVNISGERLVTMLVESDRLFQRLGRLNRFGDQEGESHCVGEAHVVFIKEKPGETSRDKPTTDEETLAYLRELPKRPDGSHDVSCRSLREHPAPEASRSAGPLIARFDERLIDLWSQTTASSRSMPRVEHWLHGKQESDYPQTELVWRSEVCWLAKEGVSKADREAVLERYRILPQETLKEPTRRLKEKLGGLPEAGLALFQDVNGRIEVSTVGELASRKDQDLRDGLILLPPGMAGRSADQIASLAFQSAPLWTGTGAAGGIDVPKHLEGYPRYHVQVSFREPLKGPILAGIGRHLGIGAFAVIG